MIRAALELRYSPHVLRPAAAWFVASSDPRDWLAEGTRCFVSSIGHAAVAQSRMRFLPIPSSPQRRDPGGALIIPGTDAAIEIPQVGRSSRCLPYGQLGGRLFLPVESRLDPEVSDDELRGLLSDRLSYVWHPAAGLVAVETDDLLSMADLIHVDPPQRRQWDQARPGERLPSRLVGLAPLNSLATETVLRMGQDDIGSESDQISELPRTSDEPKPGLNNAVQRAALNILASGLQGLSFVRNLIPAQSGGASAGSGRQTASGSSGLERLTNWAQQQIGHLNQALLSEREKEIRRLIHLLQTEPDQGLKYALPLGGDAQRGTASPGHRLTERSIDFSLGHLGGGRAADTWDISNEGRQQLAAHYRVLANREMQLGRFRRAAYIFGELLADFEAAAGALKQGKNWREASVLYRVRLKRPLDAAECLEQGGHWTEAGEAYVEWGEHERAGDIYTRLQQHEEARTLYQRAIEKCRSRSDWLGSARILEAKLDAVDEAIDELSAAWPQTGQAVACLHELFTVLGRLGRHEAAAKRIRQLRDAEIPQHCRVSLIETLADRAKHYPDRMVQQISADATRVLASRALTRGLAVDSTRVLQAVRHLAPEDQLLSRDCLRFERQRTLSLPPPAPVPRPSTNRLALVHSVRLPFADGTWTAEAAIASGEVIFAAGRTQGGLLFVCCSGWNIKLDNALTWTVGNLTAELIMAANPLRPDSVLVHRLGGPLVMPRKEFLEMERCSWATQIGAVRGMTSGLLAASITGHGITWILEQRHSIPTLLALRPDGQLVYSRALPELDAALFPYLDQHRAVPMHAGHRLHLGVDQKLIVFDQAKAMKTIEIGRPITSIVGSLPKTRARVAVALDQGGLAFWDDSTGGQMQRFSPDLPSPRITFNRGGLLIAAHDRRCEVYAMRDGRVELKAELDLPSRAVAVLSAVLPNQFGVLFESGQINIYQMA